MRWSRFSTPYQYCQVGPLPHLSPHALVPLLCPYQYCQVDPLPHLSPHALVPLLCPYQYCQVGPLPHLSPHALVPLLYLYQYCQVGPLPHLSPHALVPLLYPYQYCQVGPLPHLSPHALVPLLCPVPVLPGRSAPPPFSPCAGPASLPRTSTARSVRSPTFLPMRWSRFSARFCFTRGGAVCRLFLNFPLSWLLCWLTWTYACSYPLPLSGTFGRPASARQCFCLFLSLASVGRIWPTRRGPAGVLPPPSLPPELWDSARTCLGVHFMPRPPVFPPGRRPYPGHMRPAQGRLSSTPSSSSARTLG
ncbi:uncharacterized protein LOC132400325 [Hypanus sabinus]|uniref:uncharacterized protein LOC132400325 n=1 Tax=Hypanus sabinus TaxID=79690 RepID=UPI0028C3B877|nr:uncharacterized protein LOC132400325 [Hypanus sabinus]